MYTFNLPRIERRPNINVAEALTVLDITRFTGEQNLMVAFNAVLDSAIPIADLETACRGFEAAMVIRVGQGLMTEPESIEALVCFSQSLMPD